MGKFLGIGLVALVLLAAVSVVVLYFNLDSEYISRVEHFKEQAKKNESVFDKVFKVLRDKAGVQMKYAEEFRGIYGQIMKDRNYGGEMMKWITEQNPQYDNKLHLEVMKSIDALREEFDQEQRKLISQHAELEIFMKKAPNRWIIGGREIPELKIVTSTRTEQAFATGKDDEPLYKEAKSDTTSH